MKKILLTTLFLCGLIFSTSLAQAAPPPPPHHGSPHGGMHKPPVHHQIHRPPRHHHYVRHYSTFYSPYYYGLNYPCINFGFSNIRHYHPIHYHGGLGATFHISI